MNTTERNQMIKTIAPILIVLTCFWLSPTAQAVVPAPDGGYPFGNTAEGTDALFSLTGGSWNTALGNQALYTNTNGFANTALGYWALHSNTTGGANTANGLFALVYNTEGYYNTANGAYALYLNATGYSNTANGYSALQNNTSGSANVANGAQALLGNETGNYNTASGAGALFSNTTGNDNTATGSNALYSNAGNQNTANGSLALVSNTGSSNIGLGFGAGQNLTTGSSNIDIGNQGVAGEANTIRIGTVGTQTATYVAGIMGKTVPHSVPVFINSDGLLGTPTSSARFKDEMKPMGKASEAILALKPVTFHYKKALDPDCSPQFGLVAEEVEKVNRDLVIRDPDGKPYTVRYEAVNAMLLNEFLKEHRTVQELRSTVAKQEAIIAQQQKAMEAVTTHLNEQDSKIQKVSAQLELSIPTPRTVANNH
jgi:hypothetical protein